MATARDTRARALPPDARRAAIVEAILPLVQEQGAALSTRQIAEAAGIAEGTIFRAFADKDALFDAVIVRLKVPAAPQSATKSNEPDTGSTEVPVTAFVMTRSAV